MAKQWNLYQGNLFDKGVRFTQTDFDFTGCVIVCQLRQDINKEKIAHEFVIDPVFSAGIVDFRLIISKIESAAIPVGLYYGDFKISRDSPAYGPYTVSSFIINVLKPATRE